MGSNFKNWLFSLIFCLYVLTISFGFNQLQHLFRTTAWLGLGLSFAELFASLIGTILFIYCLVRIILEITALKKTYPQETVAVGPTIFWLFLLFGFEFPHALTKRDRILKKYNAYKPFIPPRFYWAIVSYCVIMLGIFFAAGSAVQIENANQISNRATNAVIANSNMNSNLNTNRNQVVDLEPRVTTTETTNTNTAAAVNDNGNRNTVNTNAQTATYNNCFYLAASSANCDLKTAVPLSGYDHEQDSLIAYWEIYYLHTDGTKIDTDGDGQSDGLELAIGQDPADAGNSTFTIPDDLKAVDQDSDGIIDVDESYFGLSATKTDTDGDGYSDGEEIINGFDPLGPGKVIYPFNTTAEWAAATGYHK